MSLSDESTGPEISLGWEPLWEEDWGPLGRKTGDLSVEDCGLGTSVRTGQAVATVGPSSRRSAQWSCQSLAGGPVGCRGSRTRIQCIERPQ